ncbi:protein LONGIFOLIA 1-like [Salvia divinorum]|uniref:Protein LONGIFOLIA 1-like n=1 Tax=Salvia divinorum TaxID=28513 RepID=A0ABD1G9M3_SALDI
MSAGMVNDQSFEGKQMGCITGFLQIFDRHQILSAKRHYSANRLPPSPVFDTTSEPDKSTPSSPAISMELGKPKHPSSMSEGTKCSWKFGKEAPRLSLDSRATTDAKGSLHPKEIRTAADGNDSDDSQQHRSPSVIARLMGLDSSCFEPELRRSASESRVSRDLFHSRLTNFHSNPLTGTTADDNSPRLSDPINFLLKNASKVDTPKAFNRGGGVSPSPWNAPRHRKSFFDSGDFFPETKQAVSIYAEKLRGIEEPSKDLETLKQILGALQLKGLLHSRKHSEQDQIRHRTFVYDDSPIVVMKPSQSPNSMPFSRRVANDYPPPLGGNHSRGGGRRTRESSPSTRPRRDRSPAQTGRCPIPVTPNRTEGNAVGRRSNSVPKAKPLIVETHSQMDRRVSPNPKLNPRRTGREALASTGSPRTGNRREGKAEVESWSLSGGSIIDTERCKSEGRSLLERCDKLLHSIAEMAATEMQSSPVSVLDSSLYKDESSTPSPITTRRNLDFKDECVELDEEGWSSEIVASQDCDFVYVSDVVRASRYLPQESGVFLLLEKKHHLKDKCKVPRLQRKLIFDTVHEILDRNRRLPPWKLASSARYGPSLDKVWSEFRRVRERERERDTAQDLFGTICGVLKRDLAGDGISGWEDCPLEMSEAILDIERLIFKDLIGEAIRDLAALVLSSKASLPSLPRRKLVFSTP